MVIRYYLKTGASAPANVVITNAAGAEVARLEGTTEAGINTVVWNTRNAPPGDGRGRGRSPSPGRGGPPIVDLLAPLGDYTVTLEVAGRRLTRPAKIAKTQGWTLGGGPVIIRP
jgi:hypothetical protein